MKNVIKKIFAVLALWALSGCSFAGDKAVLVTPTAPTDSTGTNSAAQICRAPPMAHSLEEYEAYLDRFDALPPEFIHFDAFKEYGTFINFVDASDWQTYQYYSDGRIEGNCNIYSYCLTDPADFTIFIYITPLSEYADTLDAAKEMTASENLHTATAENGYYRHNNLYYEYYSGKLAQIVLTTENTAILIKPYEDDSEFANYPTDVKTLVSALFNTQTAAAAVAEFNANIAAARQQAEVKAD